MKKIGLIHLFSLLIFVTVVSGVVAQTTSTDSAGRKSKEVEQLKEKIAQKVANIVKKDTKAYAGYVQEIKGKIIKIKGTGDTVVTQIETDDVLTKYFQIGTVEKKDADFKDIEKGDYIIISGPRDAEKVNANTIYIDTPYSVGSGKITEVDSVANTIRVVTLDRADLILDIETTTTLQIMDSKTLELGKLGFSKIKIGDTVHFAFKRSETPNKDKKYTAGKIVLIPQEFFEK